MCIGYPQYNRKPQVSNCVLLDEYRRKGVIMQEKKCARKLTGVRQRKEKERGRN